MEIPADGILIEGQEVQADESSITGRFLYFRGINNFKKECFITVSTVKREF